MDSFSVMDNFFIFPPAYDIVIRIGLGVDPHFIGHGHDIGNDGEGNGFSIRGERAEQS